MARLRELECVVEVPNERCWQWLFHGEAASLRFSAGYDDVPVERRPIILGRIRFPKNGGMTLQTNSILRAIEAARFFGPRLGPQVVAMRCRVVNRCFAAEEGKPDDLMKTLDQNVSVIDPRVAELALEWEFKGRPRPRTMQEVERVAADCDRPEVLEELRGIADGGRRNHGKIPPRDDPAVEGFANRRRSAAEQDLSERGAVRRKHATHPGSRQHEAFGASPLHVHDLQVAQQADVRRLAAGLDELVEDLPAPLQQVPAAPEGLAELEAAHAEPVAVALGALLDVAELLERGEQPEDVVLVQVEALREGGDALLLLVAEGLEEADRIDHRLDRVVPLRLLHRVLLHARRLASARQGSRRARCLSPAGDRKVVSKGPVSVGNRDASL